MTTEIEFSGELELESLDTEESHNQGSTANFDEQSQPDGDETYEGPERRSINRRTHHDRREGLRFDQKEDRRSGKERRKGSWNYTFDMS